MKFAKTNTKDGVFIGRIRQRFDPGNKYAQVNLFNPALHEQLNCLVGKIELITEEDAKKQFRLDGEKKLEEYRTELAQLGIDLDPQLDAVDARKVVLQERTRERHREFLRKRDIDVDVGFSTSRPKEMFGKRKRSSLCYECAATVDNQVDLECSVCGWIICNPCGACGCGHLEYGDRYLSKWRNLGNANSATSSNVPANGPVISAREQFDGYSTASKYASQNPGTVLKRDPDGSGWIIIRSG